MKLENSTKCTCNEKNSTKQTLTGEILNAKPKKL